jgi:lysophospholipase L1-like esterase
MNAHTPTGGPTAALLGTAGAAFVAGALLFNEWLLGLTRTTPLAGASVAKIRDAQLAFGAAGIALLAGAALVRRSRALAGLRSERAARVALAGLATAAPLFAAELALRPFAVASRIERTTLFERDAELGWRMRPGVRARWFDTEIAVNAKGLRGPELPYERAPGIPRVLWLGDSVTIGFRIADVRETFPYLVAARLEAHAGARIETVNGAVDGYSPWQESAWLAREGQRYAPDLVVVGFVLNDVTEKLGLLRFGGRGEGFQLAHTATRLDAIAGDSALLFYARRAVAALRFGADAARGAREREALDVETLARAPQRPDALRAWESTLAELRALFAVCREHGDRAALIAFPYAFQFFDPAGLSAPQRRLREFAEREGIPYLDLLPPLRARIEREHAQLADWFLDENHPSARGHRVIAELIADFILREGLLARAPGAAGSAG